LELKTLKITNEDNMALMARYPDNYFDLAIVDPPYGIKIIKNGIITFLMICISISCLGFRKIKLFGAELLYFA
jgi:DNA modification methylase